MDTKEYLNFKKRYSDTSPKLQALRDAGWEQFKSLLNLPVGQVNNLPLCTTPSNFDPKLISQYSCQYPHLVVLIDGILSKELSHCALPVSPLDDKFADLLKTYPLKSSPALINLNTAFLQAGFVLNIPTGEKLSEPIHILHIASGKQQFFQRNIITVEADTKISILETHLALQGQYSWNSVTDIFAEKNSQIDHTKLIASGDQARYVDHTRVQQKSRSIYNSLIYTIKGSYINNNMKIDLIGEGAQTELRGVYTADLEEKSIHHTCINHLNANTSSNQLYKGVIKGKAVATFHGVINVARSCENIKANQLNKNLLLSKSAKVYTKPQLEINNNNVQCNHGATISKLDPESSFYLNSRGISISRTLQLLEEAFIAEVINRSPHQEGIKKWMNLI